jgi:very-short-patch-repair endonuclease
MTIPWVITDPLGEDASSTRTKTGKLLRFNRREVMVETEAVMEKIYRVVVERAGM